MHQLEIASCEKTTSCINGEEPILQVVTFFYSSFKISLNL